MPQPNWRGMGHRISRPTPPGGDQSEEESERSDAASSSGNSTVQYTVNPNGEVEPIGGEEEEEEEEEAGEEEGGGGDGFPPLPKKLSEIFQVHTEQLFLNNPDLSLTEWKIEITIPSGADYVIFPYSQSDRETGVPTGTGASAAGTLTATLNGKAPDKSARLAYGGTVTASGSNWHGRGGFIWYNPPSGKQVIVLKLIEPKPEIVGHTGQTYLVGLPISMFGGVNPVEAAITTAGSEWVTNGGPAFSGEPEAKLPSGYVFLATLSRDKTAPPPEYLKFWSGYKIFGVKISSPIGRGKFSTTEILLGQAKTGLFPIYGGYPVLTDGYSPYGGRALFLMNL